MTPPRILQLTLLLALGCSEGPVATSSPGRVLTVRFTLPPTTQVGDPVRIGGAVVGRVVDVRPLAPEGAEGVPAVGVDIFLADSALAQPSEATYGTVDDPYFGARALDLVVVDASLPRAEAGTELPGVGSAVERVAVESRLRAQAAYRKARRSFDDLPLDELEAELSGPLQAGAAAAGRKLKELKESSGDMARDALEDAREAATRAAGVVSNVAGSALETAQEAAGSALTRGREVGVAALEQGREAGAAALKQGRAVGEAALDQGRAAAAGARRLGERLVEQLTEP